MAIKVKLRKKVISEKRFSLYLDFNPAITNPKTGKKTRRQFLGMYVYIDKSTDRKEIEKRIERSKKKLHGYKEKNEPLGKQMSLQESIDSLEILLKDLKPLSPFQRKHNIEINKIADSILQQKSNELNKDEIYNDLEKEILRQKELGQRNFIQYVQDLADKRNDSNRSNWLSAIKYLKDFAGEELKFKDLTEKLLNEFKEYLLNVNSQHSDKRKLSPNSALSYFNKVKAALKQAYRDGILQTDLNAKIKPIKAAETIREYLTLEELNKLAKTPFSDQVMKRAALFSSLTGLRLSDIKKMVWSELEYVDGQGYFIKFKQKKTNGLEILPISDQAYGFTQGKRLPNEMPPNELVFEGLVYSAYRNKKLTEWVKDAGIKKDITFHCFRHTYATLQLFNGTDIYTVSKMLGHRDLKTTQVYAKIVDEAKREAANRITLTL